MMCAGEMGKDKKREAFSGRKPPCPSEEGCDVTPQCVGNRRMPPELSQVPPPEGWPGPLERRSGGGGSRRYWCPVHGYFQAYPYGSLYKKRSRSEQVSELAAAEKAVDVQAAAEQAVAAQEAARKESHTGLLSHLG